MVLIQDAKNLATANEQRAERLGSAWGSLQARAEELARAHNGALAKRYEVDLVKFAESFAQLKNVSLLGLDLDQRLPRLAGTLPQTSHPDLAPLNALVATVSGAALGTGAAAVSWAAVGAVGAASTGTAISTLSGAAATSATLAWFGGGSLAAGGLGMAGGAIVLSGLVLAPAAAAAGLFLHHKGSKLLAEQQRVSRELDAAEAELSLQKARMDEVQTRSELVRATLDRIAPIMQHLNRWLVQQVKTAPDYRDFNDAQRATLAVHVSLAAAEAAVLATPIGGEIDDWSDASIRAATEPLIWAAAWSIKQQLASRNWYTAVSEIRGAHEHIPADWQERAALLESFTADIAPSVEGSVLEFLEDRRGPLSRADWRGAAHELAGAGELADVAFTYDNRRRNALQSRLRPAKVEVSKGLLGLTREASQAGLWDQSLESALLIPIEEFRADALRALVASLADMLDRATVDPTVPQSLSPASRMASVLRRYSRDRLSTCKCPLCQPGEDIALEPAVDHAWELLRDDASVDAQEIRLQLVTVLAKKGHVSAATHYAALLPDAGRTTAFATIRSVLDRSSSRDLHRLERIETGGLRGVATRNATQIYSNARRSLGRIRDG